VPAGLLRPTTPPDEPPADEAGQGTEPAAEATTEPKAPRVRKKRAAATAATGKLEGRRLYLSEGVHFRLRMLAYQRGQKISEAAEEILDKALPKYNVDRVG
jgi:hypothetical protein